ncbi:hypothetical protein O6H91_12G048200 [Diphasiastrum complanatum]|uniref:Uncharacterized protein n=1 Tax=Diphasiastrum complanatum TaxID=34168 RepID=A0ACC2C1F4_DIPCM|nr:hypothetical protein O6H91_12G048200 [Diphasiastrum complanatum]
MRYFSASEQQNTSDGRYEAGSDFPRPAVIPFQKNLANSIHLIGRIEKAPDIRYLESGKVCARSSIAVRKSTDQTIVQAGKILSRRFIFYFFAWGLEFLQQFLRLA